MSTNQNMTRNTLSGPIINSQCRLRVNQRFTAPKAGYPGPFPVERWSQSSKGKGTFLVSVPRGWNICKAPNFGGKSQLSQIWWTIHISNHIESSFCSFKLTNVWIFAAVRSGRPKSRRPGFELDLIAFSSALSACEKASLWEQAHGKDMATEKSSRWEPVIQ